MFFVYNYRATSLLVKNSNKGELNINIVKMIVKKYRTFIRDIFYSDNYIF